MIGIFLFCEFFYLKYQRQKIGGGQEKLSRTDGKLASDIICYILSDSGDKGGLLCSKKSFIILTLHTN